MWCSSGKQLLPPLPSWHSHPALRATKPPETSPSISSKMHPFFMTELHATDGSSAVDLVSGLLKSRPKQLERAFATSRKWRAWVFAGRLRMRLTVSRRHIDLHLRTSHDVATTRRSSAFQR